jgi:ssDNA-binding Zn-finger/Zn-ribbon topoisomerase 1
MFYLRAPPVQSIQRIEIAFIYSYSVIPKHSPICNYITKPRQSQEKNIKRYKAIHCPRTGLFSYLSEIRTTRYEIRSHRPFLEFTLSLSPRVAYLTRNRGMCAHLTFCRGPGVGGCRNIMPLFSGNRIG